LGARVWRPGWPRDRNAAIADQSGQGAPDKAPSAEDVIGELPSTQQGLETVDIADSESRSVQRLGWLSSIGWPPPHLVLTVRRQGDSLPRERACNDLGINPRVVIGSSFVQLTGVRSWNQLRACTNPLTFGDKARGPTSWGDEQPRRIVDPIVRAVWPRWHFADQYQRLRALGQAMRRLWSR